MHNFKKLATFVAMSWNISPAYIFLLILNTLSTSSQVLINMILPKYLIDELLGNCSPKMLFIWVALIVGNNLIFKFLVNTTKRFLDIKSRYVQEKINQKLSEKILNIEFYYLEDPYYLDLKERAVFANNNQGVVNQVITALSIVLNGIFTLMGLVAIMFTLSPLLILILSIGIAISIIMRRVFSKYQVNLFQNIIPINRKFGYYVGITQEDIYQKDIRMFNMSDMLTDKVTRFNKEINTWFKRFYDKLAIFNTGINLCIDLQIAIAYAYVGLRVISDKFGEKIGLGSFTMYISAAINFSKSFIEVGSAIVTIFQEIAYLDPFMELMELPNESAEKGKIPFNGEIENIRFENVTFNYPKSDKKVLDNISFKINKNEKISIVGLNGAGKTTLIKLICRLYHPSSGKIYINNVDIFDYEHTNYMDKIATVFQDFKLFNFSIEENITCQNENKNIDKVMELIKNIGLDEKISELKDGIKTRFGKAYDENGVEMSGGQSQKVAIARALYKNASLVILDEPTSALDPLAEAEIYRNFNNLVGNKTAIYISHRMSSSVFCDKVLIIDGGKVADFDTHKNLMEKPDSLYYKLFSSQAENYQI